MLIRNCGFRLLRCDTEFFAVCGNIDGIDDVSACSDDDDTTGDGFDLIDSVLNVNSGDDVDVVHGDV